MKNELIYSIVGNLFGLVLCLGYALYCFVNKGFHAKGKGWNTKEEAPKGYYFTMGLMIFLGIIQIISIGYRLYAYYFI